MSGDKTRYAEFCTRTYVPMHLQPWWLDAVCGGPAHWDAALAFDKSGAVRGILPWVAKRRLGLRVVGQPPFTAYAGPWLHYPERAGTAGGKRYAFENEVFSQLIGQLPRSVFFRQTFRPEVQNWLPFHWAGFRQTTRYTYLLRDPHDPAAVFANFKNTLRTDLRRAAQTVFTAEENTPEPVFELNARSFARKGLRHPYAAAPFLRLAAVLHNRDQGRCLLARRRSDGALCAGLYLAHDARQAAVLLTGFDPAHAGTGALQALFFDAILFCAERGLSLDFEGSMQPGIERAFRAFGGELRGYFQVWRWFR